jgi:midasin
MKERAGFKELQPGHLTKLLEDDFWTDVSTLHVQKIISAISELLERLKSYGEDGTVSKHVVISCFVFIWFYKLLGSSE